jgi:hypothetical protein
MGEDDIGRLEEQEQEMQMKKGNSEKSGRLRRKMSGACYLQTVDLLCGIR